MRSFYTFVDDKQYKYEVHIDDKFVCIQKIWACSEDPRDNVVSTLSMRREEYRVLVEQIKKSLEADVYINKGD